MKNLEAEIKRAAEAIHNSDAIFITAGAGLGVDSGLPDFRGNHGFWKAYPQIGKLGLSFMEMANPTWFETKPLMAWAFYGHRLNLYRSTVPHDGFTKLLKIAETKPQKYFVFTSNVDGQFQKAGYNPELIEECHGSIHHLQCTTPCCQKIWSANETVVELDIETFTTTSPLPLCPHCGAIARPNILMFGDWNWIHTRTEEQSQRCINWLNNLIQQKKQIVVIELGAGNAVPTVRMKSQQIGRLPNSTLIRINPGDFIVPQGSIGLPFGAKEGIDLILEHLK